MPNWMFDDIDLDEVVAEAEERKAKEDEIRKEMLKGLEDTETTECFEDSGDYEDEEAVEDGVHNIETLLQNEHIDLCSNWFQDRECLETFVNELKEYGVLEVTSTIEYGQWDSDFYLKLPEKISPELLVCIASQRPHECSVDQEVLRLWWD